MTGRGAFRDGDAAAVLGRRRLDDLAAGGEDQPLHQRPGVAAADDDGDRSVSTPSPCTAGTG